MSTVPVTEARAALPQILDRVLAGEEVTITRHGQPVAVIVRPDVLRGRRADASLAAAERVRDLLAQGQAAALPSEATMTERRAEELLAEVRAARDRR